MALTTDRISVLRGRPPVRAGGRRGFRTAHCWLVRSLGYGFGFIPFLRSRPPFWNRLLVLLGELNQTASDDLNDCENLHQVRIIGKRLRYAMEVFAGCFAPPFREKLYPAMEEMQTILGGC